MWVIEMLGYMQDLPATNEREPTGRISVLEDTNSDGKMDKGRSSSMAGAAARAEGARQGRARRRAAAPVVRSRRHRRRSSRREELVCDCYGTALGNVEHNANSLMWAMDNWMHTSEGDTYLRLKDGKFETRKTLSRGQWGASQDDFGHVYRNSNSRRCTSISCRRRTSRAIRTCCDRGSYEFMGDQDELNATLPIRPNPGVNRGYVDGQLRPTARSRPSRGVNSPMVYRGDRLPAELSGNVFVAEPAGNLVSRIIVSDDGTSLRGEEGV